MKLHKDQPSLLSALTRPVKKKLEPATLIFLDKLSEWRPFRHALRIYLSSSLAICFTGLFITPAEIDLFAM